MSRQVPINFGKMKKITHAEGWWTRAKHGLFSWSDTGELVAIVCLGRAQSSSPKDFDSLRILCLCLPNTAFCFWRLLLWNSKHNYISFCFYTGVFDRAPSAFSSFSASSPFDSVRLLRCPRPAAAESGPWPATGAPTNSTKTQTDACLTSTWALFWRLSSKSTHRQGAAFGFRFT